MVSALIRRYLTCLTLLLPFEAMASDVSAPAPASVHSRDAEPKECGKDCAARPAVRALPQPSWQQLLEEFGLLLPKIPQMPSACRPARQYRSISLDKMPRQPCFYA